MSHVRENKIGRGVVVHHVKTGRRLCDSLEGRKNYFVGCSENRTRDLSHPKRESYH
ncbi:unnamed protein product [Brassica oleracea]